MKKLVALVLFCSFALQSQTISRSFTHRQSKQRGFTLVANNILASNDFESGASPFSLVDGNGGCGLNSGSTIARNTNRAKDGSYSVDLRFALQASGNYGSYTCSDHQDSNMQIEWVDAGGKTGTGYQTLCQKADYYFKTPDSGNSKVIQRKLMWNKSGNRGDGGAKWEFILSSDGSPTTGRISLRLAYQDVLPSGGHGYSLYGAYADAGFNVPDSNAYNGGVMELDYDRWYNLELCTTRKSVGVQDSQVHLYVDDVEVFRKTSGWAAPVGVNDITSFPWGDLDSGNFNWGWGGQQADRIRVASPVDEKTVGEDRYVDNMMFCAPSSPTGRCSPSTQFKFNYVDMSTLAGALSPWPTYNFNSTNLETGAITYDTSQAATLYTPTGYSYGAKIDYVSTTAPVDTDINNMLIRTIPDGACLPDCSYAFYVKPIKNSSSATAWAQQKLVRWIDRGGATSGESDIAPDYFHGVLTSFPAAYNGDENNAIQLVLGMHAMNATITQSGASPTNIVTGVSGTGSVATVTTNSTLGGHGFLTGENISVSGCSIAGYNGTNKAITATSTTTFTYLATGTGTPTGCAFFNLNMNGNFYCSNGTLHQCLLQYGEIYKLTLLWHYSFIKQNQTSLGGDYFSLYVNHCTAGQACPGRGNEVAQYMTNSSGCSIGPCVTVPGGVRYRPIYGGDQHSPVTFYTGNQFDLQDACGSIGRSLASVSQSGSTTVSITTNNSNCTGGQFPYVAGWNIEIYGTTGLNQMCNNVVAVDQTHFTCTGDAVRTASDTTGNWRPTVNLTRYIWGAKLGPGLNFVAN
jgi:hypothetical protein